MKSKILIIFLSHIPTLVLGQLNIRTEKFNNVFIEYYKYKIENDSVTWAYIDKNVRTTEREIQTTIGKMTTDATFDSIADFVRKKFPNEAVNICKTETNKKLVEFTPNTFLPNETFGRVYNHFWIGAINYYSSLIATNQISDITYYKLAEALIKYYGTTSPWYINDRAISYLDSCINLNKYYYSAYLLKAKLHKENAIWKGKFSADPNVDVIDPRELNKATATINIIILNGYNMEAFVILDEINKLKKRYNWYKYE